MLSPLLVTLLPLAAPASQDSGPPTPPPRAPLRETVVLDAPDERFSGVLTLTQLELNERHAGTRRFALDRFRLVGRFEGRNASVVDEVIAQVTDVGDDLQLVLTSLDGAPFHRIVERVRYDAVATSTPFRRIELAPDRRHIAVNPAPTAVIHDDPIFDDYKHSFEDGFLGTDDIVYVYDMEGRRRQRYVGYYEPTWMPDGKLLLVGDGTVNDQGLYVVDIEGDAAPSRIDGEAILGAVFDPCVSPDGERVVFQYQSQVWALVLAEKRLVPVVRDPDFDLVFPTFSPDGRSVAYLKRGSVQMVSGVYLVPLDDTAHEYFVDLRPQRPDGTPELFEPWGPLHWTEE